MHFFVYADVYSTPKHPGLPTIRSAESLKESQKRNIDVDLEIRQMSIEKIIQLSLCSC